MDRRTFLKLCAEPVALAVIPASVAAKESLSIGFKVPKDLPPIDVPAFDPSKIEWRGQEFEWGTEYALAGRVWINGQQYRHAVRFPYPLAELSRMDIAMGKQVLIKYFAAI